jgi:hypothetical protein
MNAHEFTRIHKFTTALKLGFGLRRDLKDPLKNPNPFQMRDETTSPPHAALCFVHMRARRGAPRHKLDVKRWIQSRTTTVASSLSGP